MKKYIKPALLGVLAVVAVILSTNAVKGIAAPQESIPVPEEMLAENPDAEYYLRDCDGLVAVFRGEKAALPIEVTDIETGTLSAVDRELLRRGIPVASRYELLCLLEDFSS